MTNNEWVMARYYDRKVKGLCVDCGEHAMKGYVRCRQCEIKNCEKVNKSYHKEAKGTYRKKVDLLEGAITEIKK